MKKTELTRKELYDLVWSEPLTTIAKQYNISDNGIRKKCRKMNIPLPKQGHWTRVKFGYKIIRAKLPSYYKGPQTTSLDVDNYMNKEAAHQLSKKNRLKKEIMNDSKLILEVPKEIKRSDPMISKASQTLNSQAASSVQQIGFVHTKMNELNINVAKESVHRSLCFMQALIKLLRTRKHDIITETNTYAIVYGERIKIRLREKMRAINVKNENWSYSSHEYHPTGILIFVIDLYSYHRKEWYDKKNNRIEDQLADILAFLEIHAKKKIKEREEYEIRRKEEAKEKQRIKEIMDRKNTELEQFKKLINHANYWKQAQIIREYLITMHQMNIRSSKTKTWLKWANKKLEWFDPLVQGSDDVLDDLDREKLIKELNEAKHEKRYTYW